MALFGFNKTRSLASAEKYVQQGKIQNAISEYEKIAREDPKDITVVNTIGDLYSRLGQNEKAVACFRRVGDQYASEGYTLKAIAMYKKLAKLSADDRENAQKLADLYTQQGLYNEARSQYLNLAEQYLRANESGQAIKVFQKMLDVDPENANVQGKLADLLLKGGKQDEAKLIYVKAARSQRAKGANAAAMATVDKLLKIDPNHSDGLLLHGLLLAENGHYPEAASALEKVPNIDSVREGLVALLQSYLSMGEVAKADPVARKLLTIHHDISGLGRYAEALLQNGDCFSAFEVYDRNVADFLSQDPAGLLNSLQSAISQIKDSAPALEILRNIYRKAGENTFNNEVLELLAHAYVQEGKMDKAAELYRELSIAEPDNPLHGQNYRQIVARLGNDPIYRPPASDEGTQAFMIEQLEVNAQTVPQQHPPEISSLIRAALTDSELFSSYNLPEKAIAPLETVLPEAPLDVQVNQRLAVLYARTRRYEQAADRCLVLSEVYAGAGHHDEAQQYASFAKRYRTSPELVESSLPSFLPELESPLPESNIAESADVPAVANEFEVNATASTDSPIESSVTEFEFEVVPAGEPEEQTGSQPELSAHQPTVEPAPETQPALHEIDLSGEWEELVEAGDPPGIVVEDPGESGAEAVFELLTVEENPVQEIQAASSLEPGLPAYDDTQQAAGWENLPLAPESLAFAEPASTLQERVEEANFYLAQSMVEEARTALGRLAREFPDAPQLAALQEQFNQLAEVRPAPTPEATVEIPDGEVAFESLTGEEEVLELASAPVAFDDLSLLIEVPFQTAESSVSAQSPEQVSAQLPETIPELPATEAPVSTSGFLEGFAEELGSVLGDLPEVGSAGQLAGPASVPVAAETISASAPNQTVPLASNASPTRAPSESKPISPDDPTAMLSDLFSEFKEDVEEQTSADKDLDTHYNLGVAFREMGLLDEAIGELQTVCNSIDRGVEFDQTIQAYTWLAQCLVDKGFPEAAVRWYERALKIPRIDPDSLMAVYYDLASAYEKAGNKKAAADNFMHVYSMNIDYRDVAERVKAQRSQQE